MKANIHCPVCDSDAIYSYGHTKNGKQRYLCLLCNRQFVADRSYSTCEGRPKCPICGGKTHIYRHERKRVRFRCAHYPYCRGYSHQELKKQGRINLK